MVDCDNNMMRFHKWNDFDRLTFSLGHDFCGKTRGDPRNLLIIFFPTDMMQTHFFSYFTWTNEKKTTGSSEGRIFIKRDKDVKGK